MSTCGSGVSHRNGVLEVKFTAPTVVEKAKRRVAALLNLRNHETGAIAWIVPAGTTKQCRRQPRLPHDEIGDRAVICGVSHFLRGKTPLQAKATLASDEALRMYQASVLPFDSPMDRAYASSGWTWMESGWLVNSSFSRSEGAAAARPERSYQISPIVLPSRPALLQGRGSTTPQGFDKECAIACSIVITLVSFRPRADGGPEGFRMRRQHLNMQRFNARTSARANSSPDG